MKDSALVLSIAINLGLIGCLGYVVTRPDSTLGNANEAVAVSMIKASLPKTVTNPDAATVISAYRAALDVGVQPAIANGWLVAGLVQAALTDEADEYWRSPVQREYVRQLELAQVQDAAREQILELLGANVVDDPSFFPLFRPYQQQFPFLSSAQQLALQALKLETQKKMVTGRTSAMSGGLQNEYRAEVRKLLTEEEYFEYQLREAPEAQYLAASGFDFTEDEFRNAVRMMVSSSLKVSSRQTAVAGVATSGSAESQIAAALDAARYAEFKRNQDPAYRVMLTVAERRELSVGAVDAAYEAHVRHVEETRRLKADNALTSSSREQALSAAAAARDKELKRLLGDAALTEISRALAPQLPSVAPRIKGRISVITD